MKRKMSLLMAFMMAATLVPAQQSNAATKNTVTSVVTVESDTNLTSPTTGTSLTITVDNGTGTTFQADRPFQLELGEGAEWLKAIENETNANYKVEKIGRTLIEVTPLNTPTGVVNSIKIPMLVDFDGAPVGAQKVRVIPKESTATAGEYTYAMVGSSQVKVRVDKVEKISRGETKAVSIIFDELTKTAIGSGATVTLRLPANFEWETPDSTNEKRNKTINLTQDDSKLQTIAESLKIKPNRDARFGPIDVTFTPKNVDLTQSSLVVAEYVDFGTEVKADKVLSVIAGKDESKKYNSLITVEEKVANSILSNRYIDFKFVDEKGKAVDASVQAGLTVTKKNVSGLKSVDVDVEDKGNKDDGKYAPEFSVKTENDSAEGTRGKFQLEVPFVVDAGFTGKLFLQVKGAGVEEQLVQIADVKAPVTFSVANPLPQVKIGLQKQTGSDITIKETEAGALQDSVDGTSDKSVRYTIESTEKNFGLTFKSAKATVVDGDISLDGSGKKDKYLYVDVDRRSTKASTIKFSDITVTLDRTVPYGEIKLDGNFGAVDQRHDLGNTVDTFAYFNTVTPVANDKRITTVFTIDQKGYSEVNANVREDKTAEVAPFIQDNRTMLPVRYVANAIGATVNYDPTTRTATFEKNQVVVSINIDKDVMYVNGSPVKLFTKPANKEGRIFLPVANIAQAFGLKQGETIVWNAENKTVTILPQDATAEEIKLAQEGKTLEGTTTTATQEAAPEVKPEEKKPEVKPEEKKPEVKPAV